MRVQLFGRAMALSREGLVWKGGEGGNGIVGNFVVEERERTHHWIPRACKRGGNYSRCVDAACVGEGVENNVAC